MLLTRLILFPTMVLALTLITACVAADGGITASKDGPVPIIAVLSGDLPTARLNSLPEGQQEQSVGSLRNQQQLDALLQSIEAGGKTLPVVDFSNQIVLFSRNTVYYNRLSIGQVLRKGDTLTILAMETMSAMQITDKVAISLAVIEKTGVTYLNNGGQKVRLDD